MKAEKKPNRFLLREADEDEDENDANEKRIVLKSIELEEFCECSFEESINRGTKRYFT